MAHDQGETGPPFWKQAGMSDEDIMALGNRVLGVLRTQYGPGVLMVGDPNDAVRDALEELGEDVRLSAGVTELFMVTGFLHREQLKIDKE